MNVQAVLKYAEEILFFDFLEKKAGISPGYLKQHAKEINQLFNKYITQKTFPDINNPGKKIPYQQLDLKYKEKVWTQFLGELEKKLNPLDEQIEQLIKEFKVQPSGV